MKNWQSITFETPAKPWSTNQERRMHPMERHKRVTAWKDATRDAWEEAHGHRAVDGFVVVHIVIPFTQRRRRDPHNYCGTVLKACIDGLVQAGLVPDDNADLLGHREPVLRVGGEVSLGVEVLTEAEAGSYRQQF